MFKVFVTLKLTFYFQHSLEFNSLPISLTFWKHSTKDEILYPLHINIIEYSADPFGPGFTQQNIQPRTGRSEGKFRFVAIVVKTVKLFTTADHFHFVRNKVFSQCYTSKSTPKFISGCLEEKTFSGENEKCWNNSNLKDLLRFRIDRGWSRRALQHFTKWSCPFY